MIQIVFCGLEKIFVTRVSPTNRASPAHVISPLIIKLASSMQYVQYSQLPVVSFMESAHSIQIQRIRNIRIFFIPDSGSKCKLSLEFEVKGIRVGLESEYSGTSTQLKIAQVVPALLVEQCRNNTVIMAEQCCSTNNVNRLEQRSSMNKVRLVSMNIVLASMNKVELASMNNVVNNVIQP